MGNSYTSPASHTDVLPNIELNELVSHEDLCRLSALWAGMVSGKYRRWITRDEFFDKVFSHPDIPDEIRDRIFAEICRGAPALDYYNFAFAIGLITNADQQTRNAFLPETRLLNGCVFLSKFAGSSAADDQFSIYQILAGVTHLEENEVRDLEQVFTDIYDPVLQKIPISAFEDLLRGMVSPGMVEGIFSAFDENADGYIDFKEFVCGLSALCRGPENARLQFMAQFWDSDGDGFLTADDFATFQDDLSLDDFVKLHPNARISYPEFVCLIIANPSIQNQMLSLGDQIGNIGLRLSTSSVSDDFATCNTTLDSAHTPAKGESSHESLHSDQSTRHDASAAPSSSRLLVTAVTRPRVGGIVNMGNSCYISAALQSLTNVRELTLHLLAREVASLGPVAREYAQFLRKIYIEGECAAPRSLKEVVSKKTSLFADRSQHDCQEFLQIFLDVLHEDLKPEVANLENGTACEKTANVKANKIEGGGEKANVEKATEKAEEPDVEDSKKAKQKWDQEMAREGRSIVIDLFAGQQKSNLRCLHCAHSSSTFELFTVISLSIPVNDRLLVFVKVFRRSNTVPKRYAFRIPTATKLNEFRQLISRKVGILGDRMQILLVDKCGGKFDLAHSDTFNSESNLAVKDLPLSAMDICCYELVQQLPTELNPSNVINLICVHRKIIHNQIYAIKEIDGINPITFGFPFVLPLPTKLSVRMLYDKVWAHIQGRSTTSASSKRASSASLCSTNIQSRVNRAVDADERFRSGYPFELAFTRGDALWCATCDWTRFCRGCTLSPSDDDLELTFSSSSAGDQRGNLLTVNWRPIALYLLYGNSSDLHYEDDASVAECSVEHKRPVSLDDCFSDYTRPETLGDSRCDKCKCVTNREKTLRISRLPNILMVHLKRFAFVQSVGRHVKSTVPVNFPLDNFDPSPYFDRQANPGKNPGTYNCTAIVNHHGQLNFGHYTTFVRDQHPNSMANPGSQDQWTFFNDNYSKFVDGPETKNAYLLFYERNRSPGDEDQPVIEHDASSH